MNLSQALQAPAPTAEAMTALEVAVTDLAHIRAATVPRAIFDGQLLAFAEEIVPLLHDARYLGIPELVGRWHRVIKIVSDWFDATQGDEP